MSDPETAIATVRRARSRRAPGRFDRLRLAWLPALALALGLLASLTPPHHALSNALRDASLRWVAQPAHYDDTLIVDIDDASLRSLKAQLGGWPYRRDIYALVIEYLREQGARVIAFNIVFDETREGDEVLAKTIARRPDTVLGAAGLPQLIGLDDAPNPHLDRLSLPGPSQRPATRWSALALPNSTLLVASTGPSALAVITSELDADGTLRRWPLLHGAGGRLLPSLPLAVLWRAGLNGDAAHADRSPLPSGIDMLPASAHGWPVDVHGAVTVRQVANRDAVLRLPFSRLMSEVLGQTQDEQTRGLFKGRAVFIGSTAFISDRVMTPFGWQPGLVMQANAYAALARGEWLTPAGWPGQALVLCIAVCPSLLCWRRGRPALQADAIAAALAVLAILGISLFALQRLALQSDVMPAMTVVAAGFVLATLLQLRWMQVANRRLAHERAVADAANRAKTELLANVSHEIRTPMNAVLGMAELLARTDLRPEQRRYVEVFRMAGGNLFALINDLLELSKIEADKLELHPADCSLPRLLAQQLMLLEPRALEKGVALTIDCPPQAGDGMRIDAQRLTQVLTNLIGNAIKFTHEGAVRVTLARNGDELQVAVHDTGVGIAGSKLGLIFEPFVQADGDVPRTFGGTGLGLSISKRLIKMMGGAIWVESTPGQGSTFHFTVQAPQVTLPATPPPAATGATGAPRPESAPRYSILLAEDNEVNVMVFEAMLQHSGHALDVAPNGEVALQKFRDARYDLVLMDIQMPGIGGLAATRAIRRIEATEGRPRTQVLALTAEAFESDQHSSLAAGCDAHLNKPISQDSLLQAIDSYAALSRSTCKSAAACAAMIPSALGPDAVIDRPAALALLGGDLAAYRRQVEHAAVFLPAWTQDFANALDQGDLTLAGDLARDLHNVSHRIGANALASTSADLAASLREGADLPPEALHQAVLANLQQTIGLLPGAGRPA